MMGLGLTAAAAAGQQSSNCELLEPSVRPKGCAHLDVHVFQCLKKQHRLSSDVQVLEHNSSCFRVLHVFHPNISSTQLLSAAVLHLALHYADGPTAECCAHHRLQSSCSQTSAAGTLIPIRLRQGLLCRPTAAAQLPAPALSQPCIQL
jgi:hypothetical protein